MIVNLQRMLDGLDPTRGDRLDDPELESMYQKVVELQPQIVSLMKKYADQRGKCSRATVPLYILAEPVESLQLNWSTFIWGSSRPLDNTR